MKIVLIAAGAISVNIHQFAGETVSLTAVLTSLRALLLLFTQLALRRVVHFVRVFQSVPTRAVGIDIGDDGSRFGLVKRLRQLLEACLADTEIAVIVIVNSIVTHCSADSADVADAVQVGYALEIESVAYWATLLRAGRNSAAHTVEFLADSAEGSAQLLLLALVAG